jgi:hypothetical protein
MTDDSRKFFAVGGVEAERLPVKAQRFVGLFDVLGFTQIIRKSNLVEVAESYDRLLKEAYNATNKNVMIYEQDRRLVESHEVPKVIFSDSILIWQRGAGIDDVYYFFKSVCRLVSSSILMKMPLRGGVAFGECIMEEQGSFGARILGNPVVDAYRVEQNLQWAGAALHETAAQEVVSKYGTLNMISKDGLLCRYPVPLKAGSTESNVSEIAINWTFFQREQHGGCLARMIAEAEIDDAKLKLANTLAFLVRQGQGEQPAHDTK